MNSIKKTIHYFTLTLILLVVSGTLLGQAPEKMSYQAVVRNAAGELVADAVVGIQLSVLTGSETGTAIFVETHTPMTNANGLVTLEIGMGTVVTGSISAIDWSAGPHFLMVEIDPTGGTNYDISGTSELISVPYALHAKTVENINYTETDPVFGAWDLSTGISITESQISDLDHFTTADEADPVYGASVAAGITSADTFKWNNPAAVVELDPVFGAWDRSTGIGITESQITDLTHFTTADETDPVFLTWDLSTGIVISESQISDLDHFTTADETDPLFTAWDRSTGITITESQISDLDHFTTTDEADPVFGASIASGITGTDTTYWNNKLDSYIETDPIFVAWDRSSGIAITESQISDLDHFTTSDEADPVFGASIASGITGTDTTYWNNKLDSYTETDPVFTAWDRSTGIAITESQISDLDHFTTADEADPVFGVSIAAGITGTDTTYWNDKLDSYTETDPIYSASVASAITGTDTSNWNAAAAKHYIGELYGGGIVFHVEDNGQHGLIASLADLDGGTGSAWSNVFSDAGSAEATFYNGALNTAQIIAQPTHTASAAQLCDTYTDGTYTDWYLPSSREMLLLSQAAWTIYFILDADGDAGTYGLKISNIIPFGNYWTSTGQGNNEAYMINLRENVILVTNKANLHRVRAIRAF
jgi:hypothetical protein